MHEADRPFHLLCLESEPRAVQMKAVVVENIRDTTTLPVAAFSKQVKVFPEVAHFAVIRRFVERLTTKHTEP